MIGCLRKELIKKTNKIIIGIEPGLNFISWGSVDGGERDNPFVDLDVLGKIVFGYSKPITIELLGGCSLRTSLTNKSNSYPVSQLKIGMRGKLNLSENFSIQFKYSAVSNSTNFSGAAFGIGMLLIIPI